MRYCESNCPKKAIKSNSWKKSVTTGIGGGLASYLLYKSNAPGIDPRVLKGMDLVYATSDRGACHLRATSYKSELTGMIPPDKIEGKAELFVDFEDRLTLLDILVLCYFYPARRKPRI